MSRKKRKQSKREYSPEKLEQLRANMAKAREAKARAGTVPVPEPKPGFWSRPNGEVSRGPDFPRPETISGTVDESGSSSLASTESAVPDPLLATATQYVSASGLEVSVPELKDEEPVPERATYPAWATKANEYNQAPANEPVKMVVSELPQNPKLALCTCPNMTGFQHVLVGNSENLIPGMEVHVIRDVSHAGYWMLPGPLPRSRGRW